VDRFVGYTRVRKIRGPLTLSQALTPAGGARYRDTCPRARAGLQGWVL